MAVAYCALATLRTTRRLLKSKIRLAHFGPFRKEGPLGEGPSGHYARRG
jgi:hypothetical protein